MSQRVNSVEVKVREKSSAAGSQAFQAEVVPNAVYEDEEFGGDGKSNSVGTDPAGCLKIWGLTRLEGLLADWRRAAD